MFTRFFFYGVSQSLGDTLVASTLEAARLAVISYDWYSNAFFSKEASHRYTVIGEAIGHLMIATILVGMIARLKIQSWVDTQVKSCLVQEEPILLPGQDDTLVVADTSSSVEDANPYQGMNRDSLRKEAKSLAIPGYSRMTKAQLLEALTSQ